MCCHELAEELGNTQIAELLQKNGATAPPTTGTAVAKGMGAVAPKGPPGLEKFGYGIRGVMRAGTGMEETGNGWNMLLTKL